MKKIASIFVILIVLVSIACWSDTGLEGRDILQLAGKTAEVVIDIGGGAIVDFHFVEQGLNPLTWNYPEKSDLEPRKMGHFICFDRLGNPSPQEIKNGMPFHGEAANIRWHVLSKPLMKNTTIIVEMLCELPIGGMRLKRTMSLHENTPVLFVREEITNMNMLGRVYNIVQHPSLAPPFLDESVIVNCNGTKGFWLGNPMTAPEEPIIYWPKISYNDELFDLQRLDDNHAPNVVSFAFEDGKKYGWVTACNPHKQLLIGYLWELSDYPWVRIWREFENSKPAALGIEFGTTPLPLPFSDIIAKGKIFKRPVYEYIDAGETIVKSYTAFLSEIPADYKGVEDIELKESSLIIKETGVDSSRDIIIKLSGYPAKSAND